MENKLTKDIIIATNVSKMQHLLNKSMNKKEFERFMKKLKKQISKIARKEKTDETTVSIAMLEHVNTSNELSKSASAILKASLSILIVTHY